MANTYPAPGAFEPANPERFIPFLPVQSGSPTNGGHWRDIIQGINLAYAVGYAQPVFNVNWADAVFTVSSAVGTYVAQASVRIPIISGLHRQLRFTVYAGTPGGGNNGHVRFSSIGATTSITTGAIGALGRHVPISTLTIADIAGYDEILIETDGDIVITNITATYDTYDTGAAWPGAAGNVGTAVDGGFIPLDVNEATFDDPLSSDLVDNIVSCLGELATRPRMLLSSFGLANPTGGSAIYSNATGYAVRGVLPVTYGGLTCTAYVNYVNNSVSDQIIYFQTGGGGKDTLYFSGIEDTHEVTVAGSSSGWVTTSFTVRDLLDAVSGAPLRYPGFTTFGIYTGDDVDIASYSVWGY